MPFKVLADGTILADTPEEALALQARIMVRRAAATPKSPAPAPKDTSRDTARSLTEFAVKRAPSSGAASRGRLILALNTIRDVGPDGIEGKNLAWTLGMKGPRGLSGLPMAWTAQNAPFPFSDAVVRKDRGEGTVWLAGPRIDAALRFLGDAAGGSAAMG